MAFATLLEFSHLTKHFCAVGCWKPIQFNLFENEQGFGAFQSRGSHKVSWQCFILSLRWNRFRYWTVPVMDVNHQVRMTWILFTCQEAGNPVTIPRQNRRTSWRSCDIIRNHPPTNTAKRMGKWSSIVTGTRVFWGLAGSQTFSTPFTRIRNRQTRKMNQR